MESNIWSAYNLCSSVPIEKLIVSLTSVGVTSILREDIQAFLYAAALGLCVLATSILTPTLASTYSLSTEAT